MSRSPETLWSPAAPVDAKVLDYTIGDDRETDRVLLRWDIVGSLGHVEGLIASGLLSNRDGQRIRAGLRAAWRAVRQGALVIGPEHEDAHSALEMWLTRKIGAVGGWVHTGRSRNDQVAAALRLWLKDQLLELHRLSTDCADALLLYAMRHQRVLWPGYTHGRRAMPSSVGAWAAGYAEGLLAAVEGLPAVWARVDRSPLGSAAGYGVPLPLNREATAAALGFAGIDQVVTVVQNGRGKLEASVLFWCADVAHELSRYATDVITFTAPEFGFLSLPADLATGSSIMPQKRNPDPFELTRGRTTLIESELAAVMAVKSKLGGGYHRDFQLLKAPLIRGVANARAMLEIVGLAVPRIGVDSAACRKAVSGEALVTDEVMRRVEAGVPFRLAYRQVAAEFKAGVEFPEPTNQEILARRVSTGGLGNLGLKALRARVRAARRWREREQRRFHGRVANLVGTVKL